VLTCRASMWCGAADLLAVKAVWEAKIAASSDQFPLPQPRPEAMAGGELQQQQHDNHHERARASHHNLSQTDPGRGGRSHGSRESRPGACVVRVGVADGLVFCLAEFSPTGTGGNRKSESLC
jgi:hypothetical protein